MRSTHFFLIVSFFWIAGCHSVDDIVPKGVSTFISKSELKKKLGFDMVITSMVLDNLDNIYISDYYRIVKISKNKDVTLFAGTSVGLKDGLIPEVAFDDIQCMTFDKLGNLFVGERANHCIRKINTSGYTSILAGNPYLLTNTTYKPDGIGRSAFFISPTTLIADSSNNLLVTDSGFINYFSSQSIRQVSQDGYVKTIAGSTGSINAGTFNEKPDYFQDIYGLTRGKADTIFISDSRNALIRVLLSSGNIVTIAGSGNRRKADGLGKQAGFVSPTVLAYQPSQGLYIVDESQIRILSRTGYVSTFTGKEDYGYQDGTLNEAKFGQITSMHFDKAGVLYIADASNGCIRRINTNL